MGTNEGELSPLLGQTASTPLRSATARSAALLRQQSIRAGDTAKAAKFADVIAELEKDSSLSQWLVWFGVLAVVNHFIGATIALHLLEGWGFLDSLYFVVVVTTTVGFGDYTPKKPISKLYVCYLVFAAVSLISTCLAFAVGTLIDKQEELLMQSMIGQNEDAENAGEPDVARVQAFTQGGWREIARPLASRMRRLPFFPAVTDFAFLDDLLWLTDYTQCLYTFAFFCIVLMSGMWVFMRYESFGFIDALYVTCISASTVGFGDEVPVQPVTKRIMTIWLVIATLTLAKLVTDQSDAYVRSRQRAASRRLLGATMDRTTIRQMDVDGDGQVSRAEFLALVLVQLGKVAQADVDECLARFDELDEDGSGSIDKNDIALARR